MFPRLIVFDLHKTLTIDKIQLNTLITPFKNKYRQEIQPTGVLTESSWYNIFKMSNLDLDLIMPTWEQLKQFIVSINNRSIFGIASMIEQDALILGLMKYACEYMNIPNPFTSDTVVASSTFNKYGFMNLSGKQQHIVVISKNLNLSDEIKIAETVLIDDDIKVIKDTFPICGVVATNYFQISDWNQAQGNTEYCNYSKIEF